MKNKIRTTIVSLELICLVLLAVCSGYVVSSLGSSGFVRQMGLAIGMNAEVQKNEFNTLAQTLKERDKALSDRERELSVKEAAILRSQGESNARMSFFILGIGLVLLALILLNFYLDTKRRSSEFTVKIRK